MKSSRTLLFSAILTLGWPSAHAMAADGWGASWSFGPTTSRIIHAKTTLVPGRLPPITATTGPLFLWPGLSNPTSDLIQTTMDAWPNNNGYCGAATGQWCVEASVFGSFGQRNGPNAPIDPDDHVTIEYTLGTDGNTWTQTVTSMKLGMVVSTLQSASGPMPKGGFGFATEADADSFTIDTQYYLCTELDLAEADPHFGATGVGGIGAQYGATGTGSGIGTAKNVRTPDEGLTWLVDLVTLPAMQPQGTQTSAPEYDCAAAGASDAGGASEGTDASKAGDATDASRANEGGDASGGTGHSGSSGSANGDAGHFADGGGAISGSVSGGASGSTGSSTGNAAGSSTGSAGGGTTSTPGSDASVTGASGASSGGATTTTGASSAGSAGSAGNAGAESATGGSETSGCGCALVGVDAETSAGLSALAVALGAILVRRRRK